ncbi:amino acid ABC transporter substrate-binding protein [Streptococcus hillyeri]|uniref:Amino acid ABC transporter substrate-binding protein n=1 Tax=Streptococcus hillyeri TaxID=2282420 RepID=A0A3L9DTA8_9STRE|nr:amino acid ABC transporter substrate-binding protein [Streptococcus hillyeri]RLY04165.1 amino acid ABC transporter substrate-binding protein [Streptococcus hillyeri]
MKLNKLMTSFVAAASAALLLAACSSNSTKTASEGDKWDTYVADKSITIGFDNTFVPMGFEDDKGENTGFDIDLANAVFEKYDIKVNWQPISWEMKENELNSGNIDLIWNGYTMSEERAKKVLFTNPYMLSEQVLVTKNDSGITKTPDMKEKVLGVQAGSSGYDEFVNKPEVLQDIVKDNDAVLYDTFTQAFLDLENGRIDALLVDNVYANYYLKQANELDNYKVFSSGLEVGDFGVGARKEDKTLVEKINVAFTELYKEGKYQDISEKWFGEDTATESVKGK